MAQARPLITMQMADRNAEIEGRAKPQPLPPERLWRMYDAWAAAKRDSGEMQEQLVSRRYYHGKQWTAAEIAVLKRRKQPIVTANRIKRKVDFLVGVEQRLRRDVKAYGRNPVQERSAWIATGGLRYVQDTNTWPDLASDAMHHALVSGIGVVRNDIQIKRKKPEIVKHCINPDRFFYDPRAEAWDFSDARYLGTHQWMDIDEALELLPAGRRMIEALAATGSAAFGSAAGLPMDYLKDVNWVDSERRRLYVVEIHYKHGGQWLFDYLCGPISLLPHEDNPQYGEKAHDFLSPYLNEDGATMHPYEAWSPYVDELGVRYGVVRDMISPQDEINKRRSKLLHMLSVRQTKGTKNAVDDVEKMKLEMAKADGHIEYNPGEGVNFEVIDQRDQIQGQAELLADAKGEIENLGPNPGLIGRGVESQSGRAILAQQNSGMTELSPVFERCRSWKLKSFRKDWYMVRQFWTGERWIRITGDAGAPEFLGINQIVDQRAQGNSRLTGDAGPSVSIENNVTELDVDILLDEGPDTITMQEELLDQLSKFPADAVPPEVLIQLSNIKDKEKVLKMIADAKAPPEELISVQKLMAKLEARLKAAEIDETESKVEVNRATVIEKAAKAGLTFDGIPPAMGLFPLKYGQAASHGQRVDSAQAAQNQLNQMNADEEEQDAAGGPKSAEDVAGSNASVPAVPGTEPKLGQNGGLPLGNDLGSPEPTVPTQ